VSGLLSRRRGDYSDVRVADSSAGLLKHHPPEKDLFSTGPSRLLLDRRITPLGAASRRGSITDPQKKLLV
jgi:hypothetical protein